MKTANLWRFEWGYVGSERRPFAVPPDADGLLMPSEADARKLVTAMNTHTDLLAACEEGLRLAEIAVRQGLHFDKQTEDEIVQTHVSLVQIRAAIAKAKGAAT